MLIFSYIPPIFSLPLFFQTSPRPPPLPIPFQIIPPDQIWPTRQLTKGYLVKPSLRDIKNPFFPNPENIHPYHLQRDGALQLNYHSIHHQAQIQTLLPSQGIEPDFVDYIGTRYRRISD